MATSTGGTFTIGVPTHYCFCCLCHRRHTPLCIPQHVLLRLPIEKYFEKFTFDG